MDLTRNKKCKNKMFSCNHTRCLLNLKSVNIIKNCETKKTK